MKRKEKKKKIDNNSFWYGYCRCKKDIKKKIIKFIEEESEFVPDIYSDTLLDRLAKEIKKL